MALALQTETNPVLDENGLLVDPGQWDKNMALVLAHMNDIAELSEEHWDVINALRNYFFNYGVAPAMSNVCRDFNQDKQWVHNLFGSCLNAWRVAGLPDPGEEAKSYLSDM